MPEALGWARVRGIPLPAHHRAAIERCRYARSVFVTPPWPEIFETDAERRHSFADAMREYPQTLAAYRDCGYELVEVPKAPVSERVEFIVARVR